MPKTTRHFSRDSERARVNEEAMISSGPGYPSNFLPLLRASLKENERMCRVNLILSLICYLSGARRVRSFLQSSPLSLHIVQPRPPGPIKPFLLPFPSLLLLPSGLRLKKAEKRSQGDEKRKKRKEGRLDFRFAGKRFQKIRKNISSAQLSCLTFFTLKPVSAEKRSRFSALALFSPFSFFQTLKSGSGKRLRPHYVYLNERRREGNFKAGGINRAKLKGKKDLPMTPFIFRSRRRGRADLSPHGKKGGLRNFLPASFICRSDLGTGTLTWKIT